MNKLFDFKLADISKQRAAIMGFAILWVVAFHYHLDTPVLHKIATYGYTGVDLFFFVSGFGLFFSMEKNDDSMRFYWRRVKRIFPMYIVLSAIGRLIDPGTEGFNDFFWKCTTLGYWTNGVIFSWFIPAIVTCYFFFPFIYRTLLKNEDNRLLVVSSLFLIGFVSYKILVEGVNLRFDGFQPEWWRMMFWYRLPAFLFGSVVGLWTYKNKNKKWFWTITIMCIVLFTIFHSIIETMSICYSMTFLTPLLIVLLSTTFKVFPLLSRWGRLSENYSVANILNI